MAKNVHIVPHMHWDREWYFTSEESRILLVNNMAEIMDMLEQNPAYPCYVLDGQTAILEDYFAVEPEAKARVKALVQAGRLIIGPWYTQTDEMVVGGESIVRNLLYGRKDCKEFGDAMMIGYLPDSFGQSEKLPQILNGFDIDRCIFWRGTSKRHGTNKHNFYWESESEGKVLVHLLPLGYAIGKYLPEDAQALKTRMDKYLPVLDNGAVNEEILLPNGHDQMPVQQNIFAVMEQLRALYPERDFFLSRYENIFAELEQTKGLATIKGELLDGKYMRVHRSIFSTRADLKASNTRIENKITNQLEPLATLAYQLGADYHEGLIEAIWKELMKNHAHDSIGCCCSDKVHTAIANRFFLAEDKTDALIGFYQRKITDAISCEQALDKLVAFNLLPYARTTLVEGELITKMKNFILTDGEGNEIAYELHQCEIVDAGLIDRQIVHYGNYDPFVKYSISFTDTLPAMGYKAYLITETEGQAVAVAAKTGGRVVENVHYHITVEKNGTLTILDKKTSETYHNVLLVEDGSDDGDEYDFSPLADDFVLTSHNVVADIHVAEFANKTTLTIRFTMEIPKDLNSRKAKICDGTLGVTFTAVLKKDNAVLELSAVLDNHACDHRVRVLIPQMRGVTASVSDNQFGEIRRPVVDSAMAVWETENWDERPDSIYPMLSYVAADAETGLAVLTNSVREYEIIGENFDALAVTLLRGVGFLGKEELFRRPGRPSGIKLATPDSQMLGKHCFDFAITRKEENLAGVAKAYLSPVNTYNKMPYNAMKLNAPVFAAPMSHSLFSVQDENFVLSAFKKAEGKNGFILRGYQTVATRMETAISAKNAAFATVQEANLNEECVQNATSVDSLTLPKNTVKTYYLI